MDLGNVGERSAMQWLSKMVVEELKNIVCMHLLATNPNLVRCLCGSTMEVVLGQLEKDLKDD